LIPIQHPKNPGFNVGKISQKKSKTLLIYNSLGAITRKIIEQGLCQISGEAGNNEKHLFKTG
ncbi:MAG TPA: hypothetical protein DCX78_02015, partial [Nitrospina sp.]|nr:hypothetical protein [Nitrospina sp.]